MQRNRWLYICIPVLLVAVIDHTYRFIREASAINLAMVAMYFFGLAAAVFALWERRR
jgi:hypothetical protein